MVDDATSGFISEWNALDRHDRRIVKRLVRIGRSIDDPKLARVAVGYARYQRSRIWARFFWAWFAPGVIVALAVASQVHPLALGVVLALAAQAVLTNRNLRKRASLHPAM